MKSASQIVSLLLLLLCSHTAFSQSQRFTVADSVSRSPIANASVFDRNGKFLGTTRLDGRFRRMAESAYPLIIRYMGYGEQIVASPQTDSVFLAERPSQLPEVVVETKNQKILHLLAYVREYSTLSSYTDTVAMFREKMVDFMIPGNSGMRHRGWNTPRTIKGRSYYRFTNATGLDSVSDRCNNHFTWSDWVALAPPTHIPQPLVDAEVGCDTIWGRYGPVEIWTRNDSRLSVDINVLSDTVARRWVNGLSLFFKSEKVDFEQFKFKINYDNVAGDQIGPLDINSYSFNIESRGRGLGMFQFVRHDQPYFVTTYTEVYLIDREYITVKEAKKWEKLDFASDNIEIFEPSNAPQLSQPTLALIERVNSIDADRLRLAAKPDEKLKSRNVLRQNFTIGHRALSLLKQLTGITLYKSHKNFDNNWREFQHNQTERNKSTGQH